VRALLAGDWQVMGDVLKIARHIYEVGMAGWPVTGRRRVGGVLNITASACTAGFHWWHSGNITRMQNVSKYMLVLALCLVLLLLSLMKTYCMQFSEVMVIMISKQPIVILHF